MKRSKTLWFLIVFFIWSASKSAGNIYDHESVADYAILSTIGAGWLFYVLNIPTMLFEGVVAYMLWARKPLAYLAGIILILSECISGLIVTIISSQNIEIAKEFYIASREARGMTVNQSSMEFMFTLQGISLSILMYFAFYGLIYYYLRRVKVELVS